jgi:predicted nuclease of predicted toxin-antitoxin system
MRFLANENFPLDAVEALRQQEHDVVWIRTESPGIADPEVLSRAQAEDRILLTFDKGFGELAFRTKLATVSGIILLTQCQATAKTGPARFSLDTLGLAGLLPLRCSCRLQPLRCRDRWPSSQ